ncbi:MAG: hypothetical protein BMS9Abin23_0246 [Thermodesulfobacteriota bacterium]|nr:MAG: hypothetical protein BMS9Abin23_0246 [Thermodesulfobacteriota bacterium]
MRSGKKLESMNMYLMIVAGAGFVGLLVSLFLMSEFMGPAKKIVEIMMKGVFGAR